MAGEMDDPNMVLTDLIETQQACITSIGGLRPNVIQYLSTRDHAQGLLLAPNGQPAVFMISIECKRDAYNEFDPEKAYRPYCRR